MDEKTIKEKLDFFCGKEKELHIVKKKKCADKPAEWLNCFIKSKEKDGVYVAEERKFGNIIIFVGEIFNVEEVRQKEDRE
jgi:hypothetical protein